MKKGLIITASILGFIIISLALIPVLFKDKIKAAIDKEIAASLNATVLFDFDKFSLSVFRNFPNITISIDDFGLIGKHKDFEGDTLFTATNMQFVADIMSVVKGDKIVVKSIYLKKPYIATYMTKDGVNNWSTLMIENPDDTATSTPEEPSAFAVQFDKWELEDATILYQDASLPMYTRLNHVNHTGSGDLTQDIVDVKTKTFCPDFNLIFDNVTYFSQHQLDAKLNVNMNMPKSEYKFLENEVAINKFKMGFEGTAAMPGDDIVMDIKFKAIETEFKNILSLIPAVFMKDFDKIKTEGKIAFDGYVKGTMNETSQPGFGLNLQINDGMMQYPDLPTPVKNIKADINVDNADGITQNMIINIKQFHMDMGSNPVDIRALIEGIDPYKIDADVAAKVNLEEITKIYPIDGTQLKGLFALNLKANGTYSDTLKLMPIVDAKMILTNGYVKTKDFPAPLDNVNFDIAANSTGKMSTSKVWINNFNMTLDNEPFNIKAYLENFDDIAYDVKMKGILDLTKLTKLYPLEGTTVSGRIKTDIATKGVMSDVESGKYGHTATSGTMEVTNLKYSSTDLPQGLTLSNADFALTPQKMTINNMEGAIGKSDINVKGYFSNYMGYLFGTKDTTIRGAMTFVSKQFDANEWMTADETAPATASTPSTGAFQVPKNIDFTLNTTIGKVLYTNMTLENMTGTVAMKEGIAKMDKLKFNILGGGFLFTGLYNSQNIKKPFFDISEMQINNMEISDAYKTFNTVKAIAPVAENMKGNISIAMNFKGDLDKEMMPVYSTLNGSGTAKIASAELSGNKVMQGLGKLTQKNLDPLKMQDLNVKFQIVDGKVITQPFDINAAGVKMNLGGSNGLDGKIDYNVKMDVPAGAVGAAANDALAKLTGKAATGNQTIKLNFKVVGDYDNPKIALTGSDAGQSAKESIKETVKEAAVQKAKDVINNNEDIQKAKADAERIRKEAEDRANAESERIRKEAEDRANSEAEKIKKDARKKLGF